MSEPTAGQPQPAATPETPTTGSQTVAQPAAGTPTHPRTREPLSVFAWPCEKRTQHDPHDDCPGLKAHPSTMIGGGYADEVEAETDGD